MDCSAQRELDSLHSYLPSLLAKKYNKRGGWRCGLPRLVSAFLANNKACFCLDELLWALSFHNPRPLGLCFADPLCEWIKTWAEGMDWAFQCGFIKRRQTHHVLFRKWKPHFVFFFILRLWQMCLKKNVSGGRWCGHFFICEGVKFCYSSSPSTRSP